MGLLLRRRFLCLLSLFFSTIVFAQPTISSFVPASGSVGSTVTITGTNFSTTPANNIVFFGAVRANVTAATTTSLTVTVPSGATYQPITVTVNNLTAYSNKPFNVRFSGAASEFTSQSFEYAAHIDSVNSDIETTKYTIGDIDGDGKIDLITVDRLNNFMSVYRNTTAGGIISFASKVDFPTGQSPRAVSAGDIDGDGKPDIVVSNLIDNTVSIFKNTTAGGVISFASKIDFTTATQPSVISITDLDKDGKPDLVVNTIGLPGYVSLFRNTTSGGTISFASKMDLPISGVSIEEIRTADVDGDNKPDIVLPNYGLGSITIFRNTCSPGTISFASKVEIAASGYPDQLEIGDLNDDGKPDLTVSYYLTGSIVSVFRNTSLPGTISFDNSVNYQIGNYTDGIAINDFDGDGKADMAVCTGLDSVALFKNISSSGGSISFNPKKGFASPWNSPMLTGDYDNDGKTDISFRSGLFRVTIWKNRTTSPQIFSFSPASANTGTTITIQGVNFSGVTSVSFGGVPASSFTIVNSTTITAVLDTGATGDIVVKTPDDSARIPGFVFTAPPVITSFSPTSAATGTTVTITGNYLSGTSVVNFGGIPAASFTIINSHTITAVVGSGSSGNISVTTAYGTASVPGFTYIPIPTITSFNPTAGGTGTVVVINGTNLSGTTAVSFGGVPAASFTVVSSVLINATVAFGASGNITVTTPFGTAASNGFAYIPPPVITSFTPASGETGTTITITGNYLNSVTGVQFGGVAASSFNVVSSTTITATVGTGSSGDITIISPYGTSSLSGFTYLSRPVIISFSPTSGPIGSTVTIIGKYFSDVTQVYFGGLPASSFTIISDDTIIAVADYGYSGQFTLVNPVGSGFSDAGFYFIYPAPTITSFTPTSGLTGAQINITGTNFLPGGLTHVSFGNVPATSITVNSSTSITATVGAGASGDVSVSTPGGDAAKSGFVYLLPPPVVTSITPGIAGEGMAIAIDGVGFADATAVSFGGIPAKSFFVNSNYSITAIVDTGASGDVSVTTVNGTGTWSGFVYAPVTVTSFTPTSGSKDSIINITGTGFDNLIPGFYNVTGVYFGGVPASSFHVNSPTSITATVGSGNSGPVTVTTQWLSGYKDGFTYTSSNTAISSVSPIVGGVGETVTINGFGFSGATSVTFGGVPAASFVVNSVNTITATLGQGSSGTVVVTSPTGTAGFDGFIFTSAPVIASIDPGAAMAGTYITITGSNFDPVASHNIVYFGGIKADVVSASATSLIVSVPIGATYSYISVTSNHLTAYSKIKFKTLFLAAEPISRSSFDVKIDSSTGSNPSHVNISDFDLDGKTDVVICNPGGYLGGTRLLNFFKNSSLPDIISFLPQKTISQYSNQPLNSAIADINGDGKMDLIICNGGDGRNVSVLQNTSTGNAISFGNEILVGPAAGVETNSVTSADIDMDGKPDIITTAAYGPGIGIYRNTITNGNISFSPIFLSSGSIAAGIYAADIDMDGKPDLIVRMQGQILIMRNMSSPGNISFAPQLIYQVLSAPGIAIGDIDGDKKNDILVWGNTFSVFRNISNPGNILLDNRKDIFISPNPYYIEVGDINGDGKPDIAVVISDSSKMSLYPNTSSAGSISFGSRVDLTTGNNPASVCIADIDLDQRPDLIVANSSSGSVSFLRNRMAGYFLNSFTPANGGSGTVVTITGINLSGATAVSFGGIPAASFTVVNSSTITAVVGAGSSGDVSITLSAGILALSGFTYVSPPTITSFTPTTGGTGTIVTITGTNLSGATAVSFGGVAASSFNVFNSTTIYALVGTGASGNVSVTTPGGTAILGGFAFSSVTGIVSPGNVNSNELTVYPNPSDSWIIIRHPASTKKTTLRFIDMLGREVKVAYPSRNSDQTDIKVNGWPPGIYTIIWSDGARFLSRTMMVQ